MQTKTGSIYAKKLFQLVKKEETEVTLFMLLNEILRDISQMIEKSKRIRRFLSSPIVELKNKERVIDVLFDGIEVNQQKVATYLRNFFKSMVKNNHVLELKHIQPSFEKIIDEEFQRIRVKLTGAQPLTAAQKLSLSNIFEKSYGKKVIIESTIDEKVVGGFSAKVKQYSFNMTIDGQMKKLAQKLIKFQPTETGDLS